MKIERKKVSMQVVDHLKQMIKDKKLKPGDKLPSENQLTEMFGVSRTPVREALSVLEASGLIMSRQGGGSVVQTASFDHFLEETQFEFVDSQDILNLLETRIIVETGGARMAAERRTSEDLKIIKKKLEAVRKAYEHNEIGHQEDIAFHTAITEAAHNPILLRTMKNMSDLYEKAVKFSLMKNMGILGKRTKVLNEHERLFNALELGDSAEAEKAMYEHLNNAKKKFEQEIGRLP